MRKYLFKVFKSALCFAICFIITVRTCDAQRVNEQIESQRLRLQRLQKTLNKIDDPSSGKKFSEALKQIEKDWRESSARQQKSSRKMALKPNEKRTLREISTMISQTKNPSAIKQKWTVFMENFKSQSTLPNEAINNNDFLDEEKKN